MADFVPVALAVQLTLHWSFGSQAGINVLGMQKPGPTPVDQTLADAIGSAVKTQLTIGGWRSTLHTTCKLEKVGLRSLHAAYQPEYVDSGAAVDGSGTGEIYDLGAAAVVTLRTALSGKRFTGRVYLTGMNETAVTSGAMNTSAYTGAVDFITGIKTAVAGVSAGGPYSLGVISRGPYVGTGTPTISPVTTVQGRSPLLGHQRRRVKRP